MALRPWLENTFTEQLLLGNSWLLEKNKSLGAEDKGDFGKHWNHLYHDNGSCLDITNSLDPQGGHSLLVVQTDPLIVTDGQFRVVAHSTPTSFEQISFHLREATSALQVGFIIHEYTIRYTSYGPPEDRLRFIIQRINVANVASKIIGTSSQALGLIYSSKHIAPLLHQLNRTRLETDSRCLGPTLQTSPKEVMMGAPIALEKACNVGDGEEPSATQHGYGTQYFEENGFGRRPLIPQQKPVRPTAAKAGNFDNKTTTAQLLGLLNRSKNAAVSAPESGIKPSSGQGILLGYTSKEHVAPKPAQNAESTAENLKQKLVDRTPTRIPALMTSQSPVVMNRPLLSPHRVEPVSNPHSVEPLVPTAPLLPGAAKCSWMQGFPFHRGAFSVPRDQYHIVSKPESWHKPQPGIIAFPRGNIPILMLQNFCRMADENAVNEGDHDSESDMDLDPTPEAVANPANPSSGSLLISTTNDEPPTSPVSWPASPETPQRPTRSHQELPPDSSLEVDSSLPKINAKSHSEMPTEHDHDIVRDTSLHNEETHGPPSSPPQQVGVSDDDTEMEIHVPQSLGEDMIQAEHNSAFNHTSAPKIYAVTQAVVQVKETPRGRMPEHRPSSPALPAPERALDNTSPTPIAFGTFNEELLDSEKLIVDQRVASRNFSGVSEKSTPKRHNTDVRQEGDEPLQKSSTLPKADQASSLIDMSAAEHGQEDESLVPSSALQPNALQSPRHLLSGQNSTFPTSPILPSCQKRADEALNSRGHLVSRGQKRKFGGSSSKIDKRQSKRREIKIVDLTNLPSSTIDPLYALRHNREVSLQRFREQRKANVTATPHASYERDTSMSGVGNSGATPREADLSTAIVTEDSPRNANATATPRASHERDTSMSGVGKEGATPREADLSTAVAMEDSPCNVQQPPTPQIKEGTQSSDQFDPVNPVTVFDTFRTTYPDYTGDVSHFSRLCEKMWELEQEDKLVPNWQWDDFIIRQKTDYKDYVAKCTDQGEDPDIYLRFYKRNIHNVFYEGGVIGTEEMLLRAIKEFNVQGGTVKDRSYSKIAKCAKKTSRSSLPVVGQQHAGTASRQSNIIIRERPRKSLPVDLTKDHRELPSIRISRSGAAAGAHLVPSVRMNLLERLSSDQLPSIHSAPQSTGDPFRDYVKAIQRTKPWTSSSKIDPSKPWPDNLAVRKSVADEPKKKVDVLIWGDVL